MSRIGSPSWLSVDLLKTILICALGLRSTGALAEQGKLQLKVIRLGSGGLSGVVIGPEGAGGNSFPTGKDGRTTVILPSGAKPNDHVTLEIVSPADVYVWISPWDKKVSVPSFENRPEDFSSIVLAKPGDKAILQSGPGIVAITANILTAADVEQRKKTPDPQGAALASVAIRFGMTKEEVDLAIRAWKPSTNDGLERAFVDLYEARYAQAAELFSASLKISEKELKTAQMRIFRDAYFLGISTYKQKLFREAAKAFQRAVDMDPTAESALEYLARTLSELHRYPEAETAYQSLLSVIDQDDGGRRAEVLLSLSAVLEKNGKLTEAHDALEEAYALTNNEGEEPQEYAVYLDALADFLERSGKFDEAADRYKDLFQTYLHPREFPRVDKYCLRQILMIRKAQGKNVTAEEVRDFVLDDEDQETQDFVLGVVQALQRELVGKP